MIAQGEMKRAHAGSEFGHGWVCAVIEQKTNEGYIVPAATAAAAAAARGDVEGCCTR